MTFPRLILDVHEAARLSSVELEGPAGSRKQATLLSPRERLVINHLGQLRVSLENKAGCQKADGVRYFSAR